GPCPLSWLQVRVGTDEPARDGIEALALVEMCDVRPNVFRKPDIVVVQKCNELASDGTQASVTGSGSPSLRNRNIDRCKFSGRRLVYDRASVIADKDFENEVLSLDRANACKCFAQQDRAIICGHDDGDFSRTWGCH